LGSVARRTPPARAALPPTGDLGCGPLTPRGKLPAPRSEPRPQSEAIAHRRSFQREENNGSLPGNPDLAAQALLATLERDDRPFRLLLGNVAYDVAVDRYESRLQEFRAGERVARGADDG
jgi:hypothetical protein